MDKIADSGSVDMGSTPFGDTQKQRLIVLNAVFFIPPKLHISFIPFHLKPVEKSPITIKQPATQYEICIRE